MQFFTINSFTINFFLLLIYLFTRDYGNITVEYILGFLDF
jgi:hypothetical protein